MKTPHIIHFLFVMIWGFSFSQQFSHTTSKEGLPSDHIYRITQDYQGFIWILTDKGIVKYNGHQFKTFTTKEGLPTNDIWDIRITPNNKIWYFSKASTLGYIYNDTVYNFSSEEKGKIFYPLAINQSKNTVDFLDADKCYFLNDDTWEAKKLHTFLNKVILPVINNSILRLEYNKKTDSLLVVSKNKNVLKKIFLPKLQKTSIYKGQINDSLYGWLYSKNVFLLNLNDLTFHTVNLPETKKYPRYIYANHTIQFTAENFLAVLQPDYTLKEISIPKDIPTHSSFLDKSGNIWLATFSKGIYFLSKNKQNTKQFFPTNKVGRMNFANNKLFVSVFNKGFYRYNPQNKQFFNQIKDSSFLYNIVYIDSLKTNFFISENKIVALTPNGKKTINNYPSLITRDLVYYKGFLYGFTPFELQKINPKGFKILERIPQNGIKDLLVYKNKLLVGMSNGIKTVQNNKLVSITNIKNPVLKLIQHNNHLIICTDGFGAYYSNLKTTSLLPQSKFLSVQSAFAENNELYLATNKGVLRYAKGDNQYLFLKKYCTLDGLHTNLCNDVAVINDTIFVSSNSGISVIHRNSIRNNLFLDIYFNKVLYDTVQVGNNKKIKYKNNSTISAKIATIDYSENAPFTYEYKLTPLQKKWVKTTSPTIEFSNLQPDTYTLFIKKGAIKKKRVFTIKPLWWQTVYFKALMLFLFASLVGLLSWLVSKKIQISKNKKIIQEKRLSELQLKALRSQMNPHFVFNSLAAIQYYINENDLETSDKYLVKFSKLIRRFFELSKEEEIKLVEEINLLTNYLEIEKLRFRNKFTFKITIDPKINVQQATIPTMLIQPIVENAVNHGIFNKLENGKILVDFKQITSNSFQVTITDDGVGYINTTKGETEKLKSSGVLQNRIYYLNQSGKWYISYTISEAFLNTNNKGTKVQFIITKKDEIFNIRHTNR